MRAFLRSRLVQVIFGVSCLAAVMHYGYLEDKKKAAKQLEAYWRCGHEARMKQKDDPPGYPGLDSPDQINPHKAIPACIYGVEIAPTDDTFLWLANSYRVGKPTRHAIWTSELYAFGQVLHSSLEPVDRHSPPDMSFGYWQRQYGPRLAEFLRVLNVNEFSGTRQEYLEALASTLGDEVLLFDGVVSALAGEGVFLGTPFDRSRFGSDKEYDEFLSEVIRDEPQWWENKANSLKQRVGQRK